MKEVKCKHRRKTFTSDKTNPLFDDIDYQLTCSSKKRYDSFYQAKYSSDEMYRIKGIVLNAYKCPYCNGYHLTKRKY